MIPQIRVTQAVVGIARNPACRKISRKYPLLFYVSSKGMADFVAGTFAGVMQALACHPLDTMKTMRQANRPIVWKLPFLYRGLAAPLLTNGIISSVTYGVYYTAKENQLGFVESTLLAGLSAGIICAPVELCKIRMQMSKPMPRNFLLGMGPTIAREMPSMMVYYKAYETLRSAGWNELISGGMAGCAGWTTMFHIDVIKTRIQSGVCKGVRQAIRLGSLNRGIVFCYARAFPHNAIGFAAFHWLKQRMAGDEGEAGAEE